jgi:integrase
MTTTTAKRGRPKGSISKDPVLRCHTPSGRGYVTLAGEPVYCGKFGTSECDAEFRRVKAEWVLTGYQSVKTDKHTITVSGLCAQFWAWAKGHYTGDSVHQLNRFKSPIRLLDAHYGHTHARDFSPRSLIALRDAMKTQKAKRDGVTWSLDYINRAIGEVRRIFNWGVESELVDASVAFGLTRVRTLPPGREQARETEPIEPADPALVDSTMPYMPPTVKALVRLQMVTGMRSGEVIRLRGCDINFDGPMSDGVKMWVYTPFRDKGQFRRKKKYKKMIPLGPKAQEIITPFLKGDARAYIFCPDDMVGWKPEVDTTWERHRQRKREQAIARWRAPVRPKFGRPRGDKFNKGYMSFEDDWRPHFSTPEYLRQVYRACDAANRHAHSTNPRKDDPTFPKDKRLVPRWHPHQLRHSYATDVRRQFGVEASSVLLGHKNIDTTLLYAERDLNKNALIAAKIG